VFLGRAYGTSFRVNELNILSCDLNKSTLSQEFRVQPVTVSRLKLSAKESPGLILKILSWLSLYLHRKCKWILNPYWVYFFNSSKVIGWWRLATSWDLGT
jgi:hypothetical protein